MTAETKDGLLVLALTPVFLALVVLCFLISPWLYFVLAGGWVIYELGYGRAEQQCEASRDASCEWTAFLEQELLERMERDGV